MTTPSLLLDASQVAKSYGRHRVLHGVSFQMRRGELAGVVGENGSGKSTLLKILVGLLKADAGAVTIRGRVGYCPQEARVFERLTVAVNLQYFATAYGLHRPGAAQPWHAVKDELLRWFRFTNYEHALVSTLSGGTRQKLNLVLALLPEPDLLILDEPYNGFDWETYVGFWDLTARLKAQNKSLLIVSHLVYDRTRFDDLYTLKDGVLLCDGATSKPDS